MRIWQIIVAGLLGLILAGCRSDPEIAYLQRDNLNKQKKIEQLQNRVEDLEEALAPLRRRNPASSAAFHRWKRRLPPARSMAAAPARPPLHPLRHPSLRPDGPTPSPTLPRRAYHLSSIDLGIEPIKSGSPSFRRVAVEPGRQPPAGRRLRPRPITARWPRSRCIRHLRGGLARAAGRATRGCWWLSSPATLAEISSLRPVISAWPCSTRP